MALAIFSAVLIWFLIAAWTLNLIHMTVTGDLDGVWALVGVVGAVALGVVAVHPPTLIAGPMALGTMVLTMALWPILRAVSNRRELKSVDVDRLRNAYEALEARPSNAVAAFQLGKIAYDLGLTGHGVTVAETALSQLPADVFVDDKRRLARQRQGLVDPAHFAPIPCAKCGLPNQPGATHCARCGGRFLLDRFKGGLSGGWGSGRLLAAWLAMVAVLVGLPSTAALPAGAAVGVIAAMIAVVGGVLWFAFRPGASS